MWVKANNRTARTVWCVQKHHSTVMQPLKPGEDNTCVISGYYDIQNVRRSLASYIDIDIISIYCSALVSHHLAKLRRQVSYHGNGRSFEAFGSALLYNIKYSIFSK